MGDPSVFEMRKNQFLRAAALNAVGDLFDDAPPPPVPAVSQPLDHKKTGGASALKSSVGPSAFGRNMFHSTEQKKEEAEAPKKKKKGSKAAAELQDVMDSFMKEHNEADPAAEAARENPKGQGDGDSKYQRDIFPEMGPSQPVETYKAPGKTELEERTLHIPTWQVGILVGRAGESIEALRQASRSQIRVGEVGQDPLGPDLQSIFIVGNCDLAEQMIFEKLKERNPHLFPIAPTADTPTVPQTGVFARDWHCPGCSFSVFASREICYKCGTPRPAAGGAPAPPGKRMVTLVETPAHSKVLQQRERTHWMCRKCANMNHMSRPACNYCKTWRPGYEPTRENQLMLRPAPWD